MLFHSTVFSEKEDSAKMTEMMLSEAEKAFIHHGVQVRKSRITQIFYLDVIIDTINCKHFLSYQYQNVCLTYEYSCCEL